MTNTRQPKSKVTAFIVYIFGIEICLAVLLIMLGLLVKVAAWSWS